MPTTKAFVELQQGSYATMRYVTFLPSAEAHEWLLTYYKDQLADKFMQGKLKDTRGTGMQRICMIS